MADIKVPKLSDFKTLHYLNQNFGKCVNNFTFTDNEVFAY